MKELTVLLDATKNVVDVVGEESFGIQRSLNQAGNRSQRHVLRVCVPVPLENEGMNVSVRSVLSRCGGFKSTSTRELWVTGDAQSKDFWSVSGLDAVALALSYITGDDEKS